jgi:hypothetical protein
MYLPIFAMYICKCILAFFGHDGKWTHDHPLRPSFVERKSCFALAAWHSDHHVHLQNRRSRVRIPPGCKVFRNLYIEVLNMHCHCVYLRKSMLKNIFLKLFLMCLFFAAEKGVTYRGTRFHRILPGLIFQVSNSWISITTEKLEKF